MLDTNLRHFHEHRKGQPRLKSWMGLGIVSLLASGVINFYGLFHLGFRIPLADLWKPYIIFSVISLFMCPALYWARRSYIYHHDGGKRMVLVTGVYLSTITLVGIHFAAQLKLMPAEDELPLLIITATGLAIASVVSYYIVRNTKEGS